MKRTFDPTDLARLVLPSQPALSPDGSAIAYTLTGADEHGGTPESSLWLVAPDGGSPRKLTGSGVDSSPVWKPDGTVVTFLRSVDGQPAQLWRIPADGGEPEPLTDAGRFPFGAGTPVWAPVDDTLYFSGPIDFGAPGPTNAPIVTDRIDYKSDGVGYHGNTRHHLFALDTLTGAARQLTDGDWNAGEPAVSADGQKLAFTAARDHDHDLTLTSHAWCLDLADPQLKPRRVGQAAFVAGPLLWDADGKSVIAVGMATPKIGNAGLRRLHLDSELLDTALTDSLDRNVMPGGTGYPGGRPQLTQEGNILFCLRDGGNTHLYSITPDGSCTALVSADHLVISGLSNSNGRTAMAVATGELFGEIALVGPDGILDVLTEHGATSLPGVELFVPEPRRFTISDGSTVAGWLIRDSAITGPTPLLLDVHGGPHNVWTGVANSIHPYHQVLAARGWTVLLLNPRGSDGYGEDFMRGVVDGWGVADYNDLMEPVDQLVAEGVADPDRLALTGYSYGGFACCVLTSAGNRFAAAVAGGLLSDLRHCAGASDSGVYLDRLELTGIPGRAAELSPITRVEQVTTPTLILHGTNDADCPVAQAEQWFAALRVNGVDTRLVLYPGAGHAFLLNGNLNHRIDYSTRLVDWLVRHVPSSAKGATPELDAAHWQHRLETAIAKYQVPGAVFGILRSNTATPGIGREERIVVAAGVTNTNTGQAVTPATLFQLGSISKTWTATLVLQLVAEGKLDLDAPVRDVLPSLRLSDESAAATVTMRHLLTHTSGIDGDIFTDTGRGDDSVAKFVESLDTAAQIFPPGASWSYCNTGLTIAGRVVEVLRGMTWDQALAEYIYAPLDLTDTTTLAEDTVSHVFAVGHIDQNGANTPSSVFAVPRGNGPAGGVTSSADDAMTYGRSFLAGGMALLPESELAQMLESQVDMGHACTQADAWALGWCLQDWGGVPTISHDGATFGQYSYLQLFPDQGLVLFLSVNGGQVGKVPEELFAEAAAALAGAVMPAAFTPEASNGAGAAIHEYAGVYEAAGMRIQVMQAVAEKADAEQAGAGQDRTWHAVVTNTSGLEGPEAPQNFELVSSGPGVLGALFPGTMDWIRVTFETFGDTRLMHFGTRAYPEVSVNA